MVIPWSIINVTTIIGYSYNNDCLKNKINNKKQWLFIQKMIPDDR